MPKDYPKGSEAATGGKIKIMGTIDGDLKPFRHLSAVGNSIEIRAKGTQGVARRKMEMFATNCGCRNGIGVCGWFSPLAFGSRRHRSHLGVCNQVFTVLKKQKS